MSTSLKFNENLLKINSKTHTTHTHIGKTKKWAEEQTKEHKGT